MDPNYQQFIKRLENLTPRENQVLELYAAGLRARNIGMTLGLSYQTIKNHSTNIYRKLGVTGRNNLLAIMLQHERMRRLANA